MIDDLEVESFLARTILEVADLEDSALRTEFFSLKRKHRMGKISDEEYVRFNFVEAEVAARKAEKNEG